jgi:LysR family nitrogen assimilation transcriptional regulator
VTPGTVNNLRLLIERTFLREEVELNIVGDIDSLPALMAIAHGGSACTILPASAILHRAENARPSMRRIVAPDMTRPASVCWSHALPVSAAALAVRKAMVGLIGQLHAEGHWPGIALRPPPDTATLEDTSGSA